MRFTLRLTAEVLARLDRLKASTDATSGSEVVRRALAVYEMLQGADKVTVTRDGETETLILP